jgi:hypothetical protein
MPVHLYGVLEGGARFVPATCGLDGRPVRSLEWGGRSALVSDVHESALTATPRRLREHDAVLRAAVASGLTVVPARIGRLYADDASVLRALGDRATDIALAMSLVRGRVEMSLLISAGVPTPAGFPAQPGAASGPGAGREHLRRIQGQMRGERNMLHAASELALAAARALTGVVVAECVVESPAPPVLVARAHLVARDDVARYVGVVETVAAAADAAFRVAIRGPGAAYSFAAVQGG